MNLNLNAKTWQSAISSVGLVIGGALAWAGVVSQTSATEIVQQAINAAPGVVATISALTTLGLTIYKAFQHTDSQVVQTAGAITGIRPIEVGPGAASDLQKLAMDPTVPSVVVAPPQPFVSSTIQQKR